MNMKIIMLFVLMILSFQLMSQSVYYKGSRIGEIEQVGDVYINGIRGRQVVIDGEV